MANVLVIDDDKAVCDVIGSICRRQGLEASCARSLEEGIQTAQNGNYDIIFLDINLPDGNGLEGLPTLKSIRSAPEVIMITGFADPEGAELSIKHNAWDYIEKPVSIKSIQLCLDRAIKYRNERLISRPAFSLKRDEIIGDSPEITKCLDLVARVAQTNANILITGETGTGKELFARAIHNNSQRTKSNFVVVDCASLPESLIEGLLFGHTKGAYTGAHRHSDGFIKHADGGTLFLDEIGELTLSTQKSFLRVLQEKRFTPVGSQKEVASDFRLLAATNRDLKRMAEKGKFREDLLFRLQAITLRLPPLRERPEDVKDLAIHYIRFLCESQGIGLKGFSPDFFEVLIAYHWPGNVRELFSAMEYTVAQAFFEQTLFPKYLPDNVRIAVARSSLCKPSSDLQPISPLKLDSTDKGLPKWRDYRKAVLEQSEQHYLCTLMNQAKGNIKSASQISGLSSPRLYELIRKHQIQNLN
jgi:two-component system NtrC family response regulator